MGSKKSKQIRISGVSRAGIRVFYALDIPVGMKSDRRCSKYLAARARAQSNFLSKHPGARITEIRTLTFKENDNAW